MSRPRSAVLARGVASALAAGALAAAAAPSASAAVPAFYVPPATLPSTNGALIRTEPLKLGASITIDGLNVALPGKATRIMYRSTNANGVPVAVTGTYIEPSKAWSGTGTRPLVSFAEGTQGTGDQCAPSRTLEQPLSYSNSSIGLGYEIPNIYGLLDRGLGVVVTDYIGLGTPDRLHTYVDRLDMGRAVLDAARAAQRLTGVSVNSNSPVGFYGYSQGGGASAAAAELQPTYAPELKLKGAVVGAPPANLMEVLKSADNTLLTGVLGYAINGLLTNNPSLGPILDAQVNQKGKDALAKVATQCIGDTILSYGYAKTTDWTGSGKAACDVVNGIPAAKAIADKQKLGTVKPPVPVRVFTGTKDDIVDHAQARQLAVDWCNRNANVDYEAVSQTFGSAGTALNHLGPAFTEAGAASDWLVDRLKGKFQLSECWSISFQP